MLSNDNYISTNSFKDMAKIPYKIIDDLINNQSDDAEMLWKLLKYSNVDALSKENLTKKEKRDLIWMGQDKEQDFSVFLKPLIGSALNSDVSQTQIRLYRQTTMPSSSLDSIICFEVDLITNEKSCYAYDVDEVLCERTDLMESLFLSVFNNRDIGIGSGYLSYDRTLSRSCNSQLNISNSKNFYGRSLILALKYMVLDKGSECG